MKSRMAMKSRIENHKYILDKQIVTQYVKEFHYT